MLIFTFLSVQFLFHTIKHKKSKKNKSQFFFDEIVYSGRKYNFFTFFNNKDRRKKYCPLREHRSEIRAEKNHRFTN